MVVDVGETVVLVRPVTEPTEGEMEREVAPVVDQLSVVELPAVMVAEEAENELMVGVGTGAGLTVIVAELVTEPEELVAVSV